MPACRDYPRAAAAGVRKAPRHEVAGSGAPVVPRALWRFNRAATMLAGKPHRLNGRTIAQRFSALAPNGHAGQRQCVSRPPMCAGRARCPLAILFYCHSVSVPIGVVLLAREGVLGIDPAIGVSTARGGHALGVAGELAIAWIAPLAPLQAVAILCGLASVAATTATAATSQRHRWRNQANGRYCQ